MNILAIGLMVLILAFWVYEMFFGITRRKLKPMKQMKLKIYRRD